jgi:hypothetical protein
MMKTLAAIAFAAVVAGAMTFIPAFVGQVSATSSVGVAPIAAPACPNLGWPYKDRECAAAGQTSVRLVTTDRLN